MLKHVKNDYYNISKLVSQENFNNNSKKATFLKFLRKCFNNFKIIISKLKKCYNIFTNIF